MFRQRTTPLIVSGILLFCVSASPSWAQSNDKQQALYNKAKQEGEVMFWGPTDSPEMDKIAAAFNKKFPGITVKHFEITSGELVPKVILSARSGKAEVDVVEGAMDTLAPLESRGLVNKHDDWTDIVKLPEGAVLDGGQLVAWYNLAHPIAYNTGMLPAAQAPKTWDDLLDPKWKGKIIVEARAKPFGYLGLAWGEQKLLAYVKKLKAQEPIYAKGGTTTATSLIAGQAPIAIGSYAYKIELYQRKKHAPVDWVAPDVLGASQFGLATIKGAKHPAAAQLFAAWLASPEGLKVMYEVNGRGSVRAGSGSRIADKIEKAGSKLIIEDAKNSEEENRLEKEVAKALGVVK